MEEMFLLTAQLNWTSLAFDLFWEVNTYISVTKSKAIMGNLKIVMSRENRKRSLEGNLLMSSAVVIYLSLCIQIKFISIQTPIAYHWDFRDDEKEFSIFSIARKFLSQNTSQFYLHPYNLKASYRPTYSISHPVLVQSASRKFSLKYWAKLCFCIININLLNFN